MDRTTPSRLRGVLPRLNSAMPNLRGALARVGEYILENPQIVVTCPGSELARLTGTSEAAITRFSQRLGYQGFRDLQVNLAYDLGDSKETVDEEIEPGDGLASVVEKTCAAHIQTLMETQRSIDLEALERAVAALSAARRVEIYGFGGNYPIAADAARYFMKFGIPVAVERDPYLQMMSVALLQPGDVVIGVSNTGANADLADAMIVAREHGATVILLTSHVGSPLTRIAHISLCTSLRESMFKGEPISARINLLLLVDVLFIGVALRNEKRFDENLRRSNAALTFKREQHKPGRAHRIASTEEE